MDGSASDERGTLLNVHLTSSFVTAATLLPFYAKKFIYILVNKGFIYVVVAVFVAEFFVGPMMQRQSDLLHALQ